MKMKNQNQKSTSKDTMKIENIRLDGIKVKTSNLEVDPPMKAE